MRLIDADATIYALNVASRGDSKDVIRNHVIRFLLASPNVDAVPVIRCKDCKYYKWEIDMCNLEGATVFPMNVVYEDDYCSRAERKEEQ